MRHKQGKCRLTGVPCWCRSCSGSEDLAGNLAAAHQMSVNTAPFLHLLLQQLQGNLLQHPKNCPLMEACISQLPLGEARFQAPEPGQHAQRDKQTSV